MQGILLDPVDTLFFRDGTPFSAGSASQADTGGIFPPPPPSLTGAIRAALARANGWDGSGRWPDALVEVLGDGPFQMGRLAVAGPFLVRHGELLSPLPRHLVGTVKDGRWTPVGFCTPGGELVCDLGGVRLPAGPGPRNGELPKPGSGLWMTPRGLAAVAAGELPEAGDLVPARELWRTERRVGISRDRATRTVEEGKLFGAIHVRPRRGVTLGALVEGIPEDWHVPAGEPVPLGGEGRLATWERWAPRLGTAAPVAAIRAAGRVALLAMTPLDGAKELKPGGDVPGLEGCRLVSACCDRPEPVGGWDSLRWEPVPLHGVLPPGSVLFCEVEDPDVLSRLLDGARPFVRAGSRTAQGFGVLMPMIWPEEREVNR